LIPKCITNFYKLFTILFEDAVKSCHLDATDRSVEDILKVWLKHAPQRSKAGLQNNNDHE